MSCARGVQGHSLVSQVAGKSQHSKSNIAPPPSLAYSSPLVAAPPIPAASRIPKLRSRFPAVSKPPESAIPIQRPQWLIDEENRRQEEENAAAKKAAERRQALQKSIALTDALRQSKAIDAMKHRDPDAIRNQPSKDDVAGDGGEHPFVRESIQRSLALRRTTANESGPTDSSFHSDVAQPAAVESSCDSLGSKAKNVPVLPEAVVDDVLSFEQRRKEILRLTREAEERKKRFGHVASFCL